MLDLIFVVDDAAEWHRENIARNSHHYSFLQYYGVDTIANVQRAAAGVYYNTLIEINGQVCLNSIAIHNVHWLLHNYCNLYTCSGRWSSTSPKVWVSIWQWLSLEIFLQGATPWDCAFHCATYVQWPGKLIINGLFTSLFWHVYYTNYIVNPSQVCSVGKLVLYPKWDQFD